MDDLTSESQYLFSEQRLKIQENINRIRIMLWANDIQEAKKLIKSTKADYSEILRKALNIKTNLHKQYIKVDIPDDQLKLQGITGQLLHSYKKEQRGQKLVLNSDSDNDDADALYVLSPLASNLEILHGRLKTIIQHSAESSTNYFIYGFRVFISQVGTQQWEVRSYQAQDTEIDLNFFVDLLHSRLNMRFVESEEKGAITHWPLWMRRFTENFYVELRFYSNKQFLVQVILVEQNNPKFIVDELLSCYSKSIKDS